MSAANGSRSDVQIKSAARAHRRRFLRRAGLRASDLDPILAEYLEHVARGKAILTLREASQEAIGTESRDYWVSFNAVTRAVRELERRMKELGLDRATPAPGRSLEAHVRERYGNGADR
jgi:hypothetical protein